MSHTITVRGLEIGAGATKTIVPIVGKSKEEILNKADSLKDLCIDMIEWRVDHYQDVFHIDEVLDTATRLRQILPGPVLFTFRTKKEGGEREIAMEDYTRLNKAVAESGNVDLVDVEIFSGDPIVRENISNIHAAGVLVVGSNHDFKKTPSHADLIYRLRKMQDMGADIPKIAVMPNSVEDVLTLLSATEEMHRCYADGPIITMSMSNLGVISRLCGEVFGSAMTFGTVGQGSAPGQIPVEQLTRAIGILHDAI